ncbi:gp436 family protein [Pseudomonas segetis]|uniref:Mu-like prophage protein gp36 n=1 Tax=Pseudomonas segetis TaxID=298908 RepID=A0A239JP71_9PSED|nr:phage protein Gp36 family protein [Pseudomonas segetis]SNT07647.1 Mu-like prophage protein gp36 [Pseudomonas segetis]
MPYVTVDALVERFGRNEILDIAEVEATGEIDEPKVARACEDAAGEIDGSLAAGGYRLPLVKVPPVIAAYGCDIARYRLYDDRATEQVTKRYDDAIRFLRLVGNGSVKLGLPSVDDEIRSAGDVMMMPGRRSFPGGVF